MRGPRGTYRLFAGKFSFTINPGWMSRCVLGIRDARPAVENIIGGIMHQQRADGARSGCDDARRLTVNKISRVLIGFRLIYRGISRGIENNLWLFLQDRLAQKRQIAQVETGFAVSFKPIPALQVLAQRRTELAITTEEKNLHKLLIPATWLPANVYRRHPFPK